MWGLDVWIRVFLCVDVWIRVFLCVDVWIRVFLCVDVWVGGRVCCFLIAFEASTQTWSHGAGSGKLAGNNVRLISHSVPW